MFDDLRYDPETGFLWWLKGGRRRALDKPAGGPDSRGYVRVMYDNKRWFAHHVAWAKYYGTLPKEQIDHINGVKGDNRIVNLREANSVGNKANQPLQANNTSGYKGVHARHTLNGTRWCAMICANKATKYLGTFDTPQEAHAAYCEAAKRAYGEFFNPG